MELTQSLNVESFNEFEIDEWHYELDELIEYLDYNNIDNGMLDNMYNQLGYIIVESTAYQCNTCGERAEHEEIEDDPNLICGNCGDSDWVTEYDDLDEYDDEDYDEYNENKLNEKIDMREFFRKKFSPTMWERISKLITIMMDASYNGLRAIIECMEGNDKEEYDHIMEYVYLNIKLIKGILRLEKKTKKLKTEHKISNADVEEFEKFVPKALKEIHYRYPWKFKGFLADFDQDDMNSMIDEHTKLIKRYPGKQIPKK